MVATAPEPRQAGWLDPFLADWRPAPASRARSASRRPAGRCSRSTSRRPKTSRAAAAAREGRPARLGRDELRGARRGPPPRGRDLRGAPARSSARGPSARPARIQREDAPRAELRRWASSTPPPRCPSQPYGQLVPTSSAGAALDAPPRAGRRHRRDHARGTRRACSACASSRRRSRWATPSILKPDPQTPVCGGAMFEAVFRRPACRTACSRSSSATPRRARRS